MAPLKISSCYLIGFSILMLGGTLGFTAHAQTPAPGTTTFVTPMNEDTDPNSKKNICLGDCVHKIYDTNNKKMKEIGQRFEQDPSWNDPKIDGTTKMLRRLEAMKPYMLSGPEFNRQYQQCENACRDVR